MSRLREDLLNVSSSRVGDSKVPFVAPVDVESTVNASQMPMVGIVGDTAGDFSQSSVVVKKRPAAMLSTQLEMLTESEFVDVNGVLRENREAWNTIAHLRSRFSEGTPRYNPGPVLARMETHLVSMVISLGAEDDLITIRIVFS